MVENQDLLQSVLRDPEQDEPRERYASWCAGQEETATKARADFIRIQIALAKTGRLTSPEAYLELRARERRLLTSYRDAWGELVRGRVRSYDFNRGFVELIAISATEFLERGKELAAVAPIAHVDITSLGDDSKEFFRSPLLEPLRSLSVSNCSFGDSDVQALSDSRYLKELRWLDLGYNHVGMEGAHALARHTRDNLLRLRFVRFFGNPIDPTERFAHDNGRIVDRWLPPDGVKLEAQYGPLQWLRISGDLIEDVFPNRFPFSIRT